MTSLIIDDPRVWAMVDHLAKQRGVTATEVVRDAVEQQLTKAEQRRLDRLAAIEELQARAAKPSISGSATRKCTTRTDYRSGDRHVGGHRHPLARAGSASLSQGVG